MFYCNNPFKEDFDKLNMKKTLVLIFLGLLVISMVSVVSAETFIVGKVYEDNYKTPLGDANVTVTCEGNIRNTLSESDGTYDVEYSVLECGEGETVLVTAEKGEKFGSETGIVNELKAEIKFSVINVTVPEFGVFVGMLTLMACVGVFFFVKKQ